MHRLYGILALLTLVVSWAFARTGDDGQARLIKPADKVHVNCEEEPTLNRDYVITRDGLIVLSFVGAVEVSGLTATEAEKRISDQLVIQKILRKATVRVTFADSVNTLKPVKFSGAVKVSGEIPWKEGMTLNDVVKLAEPTPVADLTAVIIEAETGTKSPIDFSKFGGVNAQFNPVLKPGDFVFFPIQVVRKDVQILGGVKRPGVIPFSDGLTAKKAIETAGGYDALGDWTRIRLEREQTKNTLHDMSVDSYDFPLQPGDRLVIELKPTRKFVTVTGLISKPGYVEYHDGLTLTQAIRDAGGLTADGDRMNVTIVTENPTKGETPKRSWELVRILRGYVGDIRLKPGDRIELTGPRKGSK